MRRSTRFSAYFSLLRAGSAGAAGLAMILSCSDATSPKGDAGPALKYVEILVPDSLKNALGVPSNGLGNLVVGSSQSVRSPLSASLSLSSNVAPAAAYLKSRPAFDPEAAPLNRIALPPAPGGNDGYIPDVPLGFNFSFYGNSYDKLNVFANGLVTFGPTDVVLIQARLGFYKADAIPDAADPNNMIALAWSDWSPARAGVDAIRYETRGTAPNRRFILQYTNVPEFGSFAVMTVQLVLNEGSNDITIYTPTMSTTRSVDLITQGIENADGTEAAFDSTFHPILLEWYPRVRGFYKLSNDAVRFSPAHVNQAPVVFAPPSIDTTTAPPAISGSLRVALAASSMVGVCNAVVNPGVATVTDDAGGVTTTGVRSDGSQLDAAYPKGVTTITWTATDAGGLTSSASQTVTVSDKEKPVLFAPAAVSARTDRGKNSATVPVGDATALDNCQNVTVASARSDGAELSAPYPIGLTSVIWTATDEAGNISSASQSIDIHGNLPPVVSAPASFVVNTDARVCNALANIGIATVADDDVGSTVEGRRSDGWLLNAAYPKGMTTITWTATDADGLSSAATQTLTVGDGEKPSITSPAGISTGNDRGRASAVVAVGTASAEDNCPDVVVNGSRNDAAALDAPYNVGVTTITWTARDASGNSAAATQSITVLDVEGPTITVPASMRVKATSASGAWVNYTISSSDNVGVTDVSCTRASGTEFPLGSTSVTCSASDAAGHTTSKSFSVTVLGSVDQRLSLIDFVLSRDPELPNGTANPLVNQLRAAAKANDKRVSCTKMADFIRMVGKKASDIEPEDASYMISEAKAIMGLMECS